MQTAGTVLKGFYDAIVAGDLIAARNFLADDMVYEGVFRTFTSADAYMVVFRSFLEFTTRLDVKVILSEGDQAAIFYEMETTKPVYAVTFVGELHQVRDGKIVFARAACDGRSFAPLFPS